MISLINFNNNTFKSALNCLSTHLVANVSGAFATATPAEELTIAARALSVVASGAIRHGHDVGGIALTALGEELRELRVVLN